MIALTVVGLYLAGWLAFTVPAARYAADSPSFSGRCSSVHYSFDYRSHCRERHGVDCWQAEGGVTPALIGKAAVVGLLWPIAIFPAFAFYLATRKPTPLGLQRRVKELEQELGL